MFEAVEHARNGNVGYFETLTPPELAALLVGRDEDGRTLLHTAAANGYLPLVQLLAERGASKVADKQDDEVRARSAQLSAWFGEDVCRRGACVLSAGGQATAARPAATQRARVDSYAHKKKTRGANTHPHLTNTTTQTQSLATRARKTQQNPPTGLGAAALGRELWPRGGRRRAALDGRVG